MSSNPKLLPTAGQYFHFNADTTNSGVCTVQSGGRMVSFKKNGKPVKAGDIQAGTIVTVNRITGEIETNQTNEWSMP